MKIRSRATLWLLIMVGLLLNFSCSDQTATDKTDTESATTQTDTLRYDSSTRDTDIGFDTSSNALPNEICVADTDYPDCGSMAGGETCVVRTEADGVTAAPFEICLPGDDAITSNRAAVVSVTQFGADPNLLVGNITISNELAGDVTAISNVRITQAYPPNLVEAKIGTPTQTATGYAVDINLNPDGQNQFYHQNQNYFSLEITLEVGCDDGTARQVSATTHFSYCEDSSGINPSGWLSSGERCSVCYYICEMAASSIVPEGKDLMALPNEIGVEIIPVMRFGKMVSLVAEPRGTHGKVRYQWMTDSGAISADKSGGIVWTLPHEDGWHQVTLCVEDNDSAAVTSFRTRQVS